MAEDPATADSTKGTESQKSVSVRFLERLKRAVWNMSLLFIWVGMIVLFGLLEPDVFLSTVTLRSVLADQAITAMMAMSLIMPIASNKFDLSVAGMMGLSAILVATFIVKVGMPWPLAILLTLLCGLIVGGINVFVVVHLKINSFIATLATLSILGAMIQWISDGDQIAEGIPSSFKEFGRRQFFNIPLPVFYMLAIALVLAYVLDFRQFGRYLYATGSNEDAARLAGVNTRKVSSIALMVSATIATIVGIVFTMRIGAASIDVGMPYLLPSFAATFLGATQFKEGNVNVPGTIVAVYVLATGVKGVQLMGAPYWIEDLFFGLALLIAVGLAVRSGRQRSM